MSFLHVPTAMKTNEAHVDNSLPHPLTAVERNEVHVVDFLPPPLPAAETNEVHADDSLSLPPAVRVEQKQVREHDLFRPRLQYEYG